ncbi:hypothetical protein ABFY62_31035 [Pseudomonas aeruginosa]|uniref:hypothetical protein n=1 Tax=Pseudomonas aeruginosa TaxID=287 RepID=UPI003D2DA2D5
MQSFTVHYPELSARIIEELGLESSTGSVLTSVRDVEAAKEAFKHLGDELDVPAAVKRRKEQALLRTILLSNKASECCALCGRDLPVDLLVIGHIRKRHSCPPEMKKDLANVMPVCLLGCDRLFENGYVFIDSTGTIQQGPALKNRSVDSGCCIQPRWQEVPRLERGCRSLLRVAPKPPP